MKKLLIASNLLLLGIILFLSCNNNQGNTEPSFVATGMDSCSLNLCKSFENLNIDDLRGQINSELATSMSVAYNADAGKNYVCQGDGVTRTEDASSIVFDLVTLKKYIKYIESTICDKGCNDGKLQLGIRFYYAKYPSYKEMQRNEFLNKLDPSYANKHTLFGVPVYRHLYSKEDFMNFSPALTSRSCRFMWDTSGVIPPSTMYLLTTSGEETEQNHGSLRPPPAGSGVFPEN